MLSLDHPCNVHGSLVHWGARSARGPSRSPALSHRGCELSRSSSEDGRGPQAYSSESLGSCFLCFTSREAYCKISCMKLSFL